MRYLVTGGFGYLGSHLVEHLASEENEIVIFDSQIGSRTDQSARKILDIQGDVSNPKDVFNLAKYGRFDGIFHLAARKSVSESSLFPSDYWRVNLQGTQNLLDFCKDQDVKKIVFTSSAAIYGNLSLSRAIRETDPTIPTNVYGETKLAGEELVSKYASESRAAVISMRCFNLAGTNFPQLIDKIGENVLPIMMRCLSEKRTFPLFGSTLATPDGSCIRDYVSVRDAADAHVAAMKYIELNSAPIYEAINVSTGRGVSVRELVGLVERISQKRMEIEELDKRTIDPVSSIGDASKANFLLNWSSSTSIETIVRQTVNAFL